MDATKLRQIVNIVMSGVQVFSFHQRTLHDSASCCLEELESTLKSKNTNSQEIYHSAENKSEYNLENITTPFLIKRFELNG